MKASTILKNMKLRGRHMAAANKACEGTPNDHGQFYRCVERKMKRGK